MADTIKDEVLYRAIPDLRGGKLSDFGLLELGGRTWNSARSLSDYVCDDRNKEMNAVLTIKRPWWCKLPWVDGHACNIIKRADKIHLVDAQKQIYQSVDLPVDQTRLTALLKNFMGSVSHAQGSITLFNVGFPAPQQ